MATTIDCDVVVIGGGHAGCEAAAAAARAGADTVLLTQRRDTIGEMSCNPSFGGIGKGTLVREIDALDGLMGRVVDQAGIQFRILNRSKGPAVQAPRAQADRDLYKRFMLEALEGVRGLRIHEDSAEDLLLEERTASAATPSPADAPPQVHGVVTGRGDVLRARRVIITTGTFLRGMIHLGPLRYPAGRHKRDSADVEAPSVGLAATLERLRFPLSRLTTGTPPRLDGRTIDYTGLEEQKSDDPPPPFSYLNDERGVLQAGRLVSCFLTATHGPTHDIIARHRWVGRGTVGGAYRSWINVNAVSTRRRDGSTSLMLHASHLAGLQSPAAHVRGQRRQGPGPALLPRHREEGARAAPPPNDSPAGWKPCY
jgi:tRNA uridine 5-carboxymethylaminomethyl modification enzyme